MASPLPNSVLLSYLKVDAEMERKIGIILRRMASGVEADIRALGKQSSFSSRIIADQKRLMLTAIRTREAASWNAIGNTVASGKAQAAAAAVSSTAAYTDMVTKLAISAEERRSLLDSAMSTAARNVDVAISRELESKIPLSAKVYRTRELVSGQVDRVITKALGRGQNASQIAKEVKQFISPNVSGGMSYAAKRLGRTEVNNAFHATQIAYAKGNPFITGMQWMLSGSHPRPDRCNDLADSKPFPAGQVPRKPHPQCLCFLIPETVSDDDFLKKYKAGAYDDYLAGTETAVEDVASHAPQTYAYVVPKTDDEKLRAAVKTLIVRANTLEPAITKKVVAGAEEYGGYLEGLAFRIKGEDSLFRKIEGDIAGGKTFDEAASGMSDVLRYTTVLPDASYTNSVEALLDAIRADGNTVKVKNFWLVDVEKNPYQGINVQVLTRDGQKYELQFHTAESFNTKEYKMHKLYEEHRALTTSAARKQELSKEMAAMAREVPMPPGVTTMRLE
jgi:hypothetical protein